MGRQVALAVVALGLLLVAAGVMLFMGVNAPIVLMVAGAAVVAYGLGVIDVDRSP